RASRLFLFPFSGFLGAIIYWQVYRSIPESRNSVESYLLILHNTDSLPLLLATIPTLGFVLFFIFRKLNNFFATFLCIIAIVSWLLGLSEFFIRTYSVGIRAILLALSLTSVGLLFFIFRFAFVKSLQDSRLQCGILMTIWAILAFVISSSPHHDIRRVFYATKSDSKVI
ncbi:MAG: hypothetical protein NZL92_12585, partial [Gloeomargarita sp. SKYG116]|nr:hypothetical protein [Gloeomargarita sp. SKYG116]MDW8402516.1 hypothetical protein [Gloeomargarita sp. SKYGB_i_bin116]